MPKPRRRTAAATRLSAAKQNRVRTVRKKKPITEAARFRQPDARMLTPDELEILRLEREFLKAIKATLNGLRSMKRELVATLQDLKARLAEAELQAARAARAVEQEQSIIEDVGDFLWDVVKAVSPVDLGDPAAPRPVTAEAMVVISLQEQVEQVKIQLEQVEIEIKRCLASIENFKKRMELARGLPRGSVLRAMARSFDR